MAHTTSTATTDLLDGPADTLLQEDHAAAAYWLAIENAENLRAHGPVAGEYEPVDDCDDCAAVRAEVAAMGDAVNEDDVLLDEDGNVVCEACFERYASPLHLPQEGE